MKSDATLEQELQSLGAAVAPEASFVEKVMFRTSQTHIAPPPLPALRGRLRALVQPRIAVVAACVVALAFVFVWPFGGRIERSADGWWLGSASAYAQDLVKALDNASTTGITAREETTFILSNSSRHLSSTTSTFFLSREAYRRDIYDGKQLRETQWYVPEADALTHTSIRFDTKTWQIDKQPKESKTMDRIAELRSIVKAVDRADRRLEVKEIECQKCVGFEIAADKVGGQAPSVCRVWFNIETKLPVRIESEFSKLEKSPEVPGFILTTDHFNWTPSLPGNTFVPNIPEGFAKASQ